MVGDLLEFRGVYGEHVFEVLDFLQKAFWHIGHRTYTGLISIAADCSQLQYWYVPLRDGLRLGPNPTMLAA
jgi:hypothetical protein